MNLLIKRHRIKILTVLLLLGCFAVLSGCSDDNNAGGTTDSLVVVNSTVSEQTTASITAAIVPELKLYSCKNDYKNSSGYTYSITTTMWEPIPAGTPAPFQHPQNNNFTETYDQTKDLAIPMRIVIQNMTPGFALEDVVTHFVFLSAKNDDSNLFEKYMPTGKQVDLVASYTNGNKTYSYDVFYGTWGWGAVSNELHCNPRDLYSWHTWESLPAGSKRKIDFFIIIHNYMSPNYPKGCKEILNDIAVDFSDSVYGNDTDKKITLSGRIYE